MAHVTESAELTASQVWLMLNGLQQSECRDFHCFMGAPSQVVVRGEVLGLPSHGLRSGLESFFCPRAVFSCALKDCAESLKQCWYEDQERITRGDEAGCG